MIAASPTQLLLILLFLISWAFFIRDNLPQRHRAPTETSKTVNEWSEVVLHRNNASSFEHDGVFDETAEGAPRLAQVSMQFGAKSDLMYERGLRTHIENGEKWGYPTHFLRQDIVGKGDAGEGMYDKPLYLLTIMVNEMTKPFGKRAEWIVWFDADTILLNHNIPWTLFLPPNTGIFRDINMLISRDWQGFNAGIFLIRVCEWSIQTLSDATALPRLKPDVDLPFREQDALKWVFEQPHNKKHRLWQPRHWFNAYDFHYVSVGEVILNGSLVVHFPGMGAARPDGMGKWLDVLDHTPEKLRIPLQNTSYPAEVEAYWSRLKSAALVLQRSEDWRNSFQNTANEAFTSTTKQLADNITDVEISLRDLVQEDPTDAGKMKEGVLRLDRLLKEGTRIINGAVLKSQDDMRKAMEEQEKEAEKEMTRKAEEVRKKNQEEKRVEEEQRRRERMKAEQGEVSNEYNTAHSNNDGGKAETKGTEDQSRDHESTGAR